MPQQAPPGGRGLMDRFLSHYVHSVDSKGRISVPAAYRQVLASRDIRDLFAMRNLDLPVMNVGGPDLAREFELEMEKLDPFSPEYQDLAILAYGDGTYLKTDSEGRIIINDLIREHTGITDRATFVGVGNKFQLWRPEDFEEKLSALRERAAKTRAAKTRSAGTTET
ncbi:division/cell wall cluster transcriptional repressor MraZ [Fulvimarina sp. 2208YS6-2-32]|uniref:Transcriptional regulator MraZ n=1 Tax=Fulvimarina uroteuthidis TaxID=3098149 RepID=A0ABU5I908_9HYPH|nr:division/cell wall cluster transcriptional repressor MraZ [Fulvimarina sp. 2208YS6-2-32]MDY8110751.1 division/cell wall cluster transcriptional repressor MraZ [Fulvimarina sp. 2208YS6-2-32]